MKMWYIVMLLFLADAFAQQQFRAVRPDILPSTQLVTSADVAFITLLQQLVCNLKVELTDCCSFLTSQIDAVETDINNRLGSIVDIFGNLTAADQVIQNMLLVLSIIDTINDSVISSLVDVIQSSGSSFDQIISQIDADIQIDQTIDSNIDSINTQLDTIESVLEVLVAQDCQSVHEVMISTIDAIAGQMESVLVSGQQIAQVNQTIVSQVDILDTQFDAVQSEADQLAADACASSDGIIASNLSVLQQQEASCCAEISLQIDDIHTGIDTRLSTIQTILNIVSHFSIDGSRASAIVSVVEFIENNGLGLFVESSFDHISSQIESLQACASIPVSASGTISAPGNYCLTQNISGPITIAASNVSLDLNGFTVNVSFPVTASAAVVINAGLEHISITNGYIIGTNTGVGLGDGILIQGSLLGQASNDIFLSGLNIRNASNGVRVNDLAPVGSPNVTNLVMSDLIISYEQFGYGCKIRRSQGICQNCFISLPTAQVSAVGFSVSPYVCFVVKNVRSINSAFGFEFLGNIPNTSHLIIADACHAYTNTVQGFYLKNCNVGIYNCISSNNGGNGFYFDLPDSTGFVYRSLAIANTGGGFVLNGTTSNVKFAANYSTDNKLLGTNQRFPVNYGYSNTNVFGQGTAGPFWWQYWNSNDADKWTNVNGSNPT